MEFILQLLGSYCFPIVIAVASIFALTKQSKDHKSEIETITKTDKEQYDELYNLYNTKVDAFTNAINNNTRVMEKFIEITTKKNQEEV